MSEITEKTIDIKIDNNTAVENSIIEAVETDKATTEKMDKRVKKPNVINKRIDFKEKTFKKLQMMMPIYQNEIDDAGQNEVMSYVVEKAINKLFDEEFKKIVEEL